MIRLLSSVFLFLAVTSAHALQIQPYTADKLAQLQAAGKPVSLHFHATWCGTCIEQEKALLTLKSDPALTAMTLLVVDYDSNKPLRRELKVLSQSVFVVYKGSKEVAREGGETSAQKIKNMLSKGL